MLQLYLHALVLVLSVQITALPHLSLIVMTLLLPPGVQRTVRGDGILHTLYFMLRCRGRCVEIDDERRLERLWPSVDLVSNARGRRPRWLRTARSGRMQTAFQQAAAGAMQLQSRRSRDLGQGVVVQHLEE